jgi:hypothetical protein
MPRLDVNTVTVAIVAATAMPNRALWVIVLVRVATDPRTRQYVTRRTGQGLSKNEIIRCLKRHVAREIYRLLRLDAIPAAAPDPV